MIDFKFKVCYDFTGVTKEEMTKILLEDYMLRVCVNFVLNLLQKPLETVYLYKMTSKLDEGGERYYWIYTNDTADMEVVLVRDLLDTPVLFNYNKHKIFIL